MTDLRLALPTDNQLLGSQAGIDAYLRQVMPVMSFSPTRPPAVV